MKPFLGVLVFAIPSLVLAKNPGRLPANSADMRALNCTVEFKTKGMIWQRTQDSSWLLNVKKGQVELKSLADVKVVLTRDTTKADLPIFTLSISQKNKSLGQVINNHSNFEYAAPVNAHIDDGEDGYDIEQIRVSCDAAIAAG